jgi:hypothetical protein
MATISNTPRPGYVWDSTDNVWYPIGVGAHSHSEIQKTIVDAKGDIIVATASDAVDRLAVGTNGQVLTADSSTGTGLKWAAGGKVLQVVSFVYGTQTSSTSGTFADTGVTLSITPSSATSKVLVLVNMQGVGRNSTNSSGVYLKLLRGSTVIQQMGDANGFTNGSSWTFDSVGSTYLDSPATTSATTYKVQFAQVSPVAGTVYVQEFQSVTSSAESSITLMEIGA